MPAKVEDLSVPQLKTKLVAAAKETKEAMAEMLYYLRQKIKAQGKKGEGFGAWVEDNLGITRRTADNWANEWAEEEGISKKPTSGKNSKGGGGLGDYDISDGPPKVYFTLNLELTLGEQDDLILAWGMLGEEPATRLIYNTLTAAVKAQEPPKTDIFKVESSELDEIGVLPPKQPAGSERLPFLKDGQAR